MGYNRGELDEGIGMMRVMRGTLAGVLMMAAAGAGCSAKKVYPDLTPGRHSADYHTVFGRIQRVAQKDPLAPPVWIIRYGYSDSDSYGGKLNLTPPEKLTGYSGGEMVMITGSVRREMMLPGVTGTWYYVDSIRMWQGLDNQ